MAIEQNDRDQRDVSPVDAKTDVGPGTGHAYTQHGVATGEIDREIDVKNIVWMGAGLVVVALVVHLLIWGLLRGFDKMDDRRDVPLTPIEASSPQPVEFPGPNLQTTPEQDLRILREEEDRLLGRASWVSPQQGTVRVPVDVAIDVIARRGVDPGVVGGTGGGAVEMTPPAQPAAPPPAPQRLPGNQE